ncbi:sigma-70 family RNA polymerase sigma factor [Mariniflexile sp.]|uniref:sigma-70 family RNA polymerase sigma factor n=1 Tax=Mariniflexile sp. TaxID=1979402 RepID=UPI0040472A9D
MAEEVQDLLFYVSEKETDQKMANESFSLIYKRFSEFVFNSVKKSIYLNSESEKTVFANTVTNNTFMEVYNKPLDFEFDSRKHKTQDDAFRVYLAAIAKNEKNDLLRESLNYTSKQTKIIDDDEHFFEPSISPEIFEKLELALSTNRKILEDALYSLSERDRYIILTYYDNYEKGKNTPSEVLDNIEQLYGTTRDNIRMIRSRVKKKLISEIESKSKLKAV